MVAAQSFRNCYAPRNRYCGPWVYRLREEGKTCLLVQENDAGEENALLRINPIAVSCIQAPEKWRNCVAFARIQSGMMKMAE